MFNHDLAHTGSSTSAAPTTNQTLWTYTTGGAVESSPVVVDGIVYVGSDDGYVYALNAYSGALDGVTTLTVLCSPLQQF